MLHIVSLYIVAIPNSCVSKNYLSGPGYSKLTTSLINVLLKFQTLISDLCQYFSLKKCGKILQCKSFSHFINTKYQCI